MPRNAHRSLAVVLRKHDFSETSQILVLFTAKLGKVRVLARGVKRKNNRSFEGVPDLLELGEACWLDRGFTSVSAAGGDGGGLALLTDWKQARRFAELQTDLTAVYTGLYLGELLDGLTEDGDPHPGLMESLTAALGRLAEPETRSAASVDFQLRLLRETGLLPIFTECAACGGSLFDARRSDEALPEVFFSSRWGGMICRGCEPSVFDKRWVPLESAMVLATLARRIIANNSTSETGGGPDRVADHGLDDGGNTLQAPSRVWAAVGELLHRYFRDQLGRELRTARFLWPPTSPA